jgi:hypothetical protein
VIATTAAMSAGSDAPSSRQSESIATSSAGVVSPHTSQRTSAPSSGVACSDQPSAASAAVISVRLRPSRS